MARAEKQRDKAAKRAQKKDQEPTPVAELTLEEADLLRSTGVEEKIEGSV